MNIRNWKLVLSLWAGWSVAAMAQQPVDTVDVKKRFPASDAILSAIDNTYEFILDKEGPAVLTKTYREYYYVTDKSKGNSQSIRYSTSFETDVRSEAYLYIPKGKGRYTKERIREYSKSKEVSESIFYDDSEQLTYTYSGITRGSYTSLQSETRLNNVRLMPTFYFKRELPSLLNRVTIIVPAEFKVRFSIFGDSSNVQKTRIQKGNKVIYTWETRMTDKIDFEESSPALAYYVPHLVVIPEGYTQNGQYVSLVGSVKDLFKLYNSYVEKVDKVKSPEIQKLADSLTANVPDTLAKVKEIYKWVQTNINYVAFEDGMGGFIPRESPLVLTRRFGDCKDIASLLVALIKASGIPAYYVWIGTRDIPYTYSQVPTPVCDNHMIAAVKNKGEWLFLDGTSTYLRFGFPTSMIQSKEGLIRLNDTAFTIAEVPVMAKDLSTESDTIHLSIDKNGTLMAKASNMYSGYFKESIAETINHNASESDKKDAMTSLVRTGNNKFKILDISSSGLKNNDENARIAYSFELPSYSRTIDKNTFINMNLEKSLNNDLFESDKRKTARQYRFKFVYSQVITLQIPDNMEFVSMPQNSSFASEKFGYTMAYKHEPELNRIVLNKTVYVNEIMIEKDMFSEWNEMVGKISSAYRDLVIIKNK